MRTALTTLLLVAVVSACNDDNHRDDFAAVRVVHAAPGAPPVDIFVDPGTGPIITALAYGQASPYIDLQQDDYTIVVRVSGSDTIIDEAPLSVTDGEVVTVVAAGHVGSPDPSNTFRLLPLVESFDKPAENETEVRLVNASPDAPTLDVDLVDTTSVGTTTLARFEDTGADPLVLPANEMLQVDLATNGAPLTAFTTPSLPSRGHLFVIAIGNVDDLPRVSTGLSLLVVSPDGVVTTLRQNPTVYALHASPDAPAVDIHAGATGPVLIPDLAFGELGSVQVAPGDYALSFFPAGSRESQLGSSDVVVLNPGERYLAVATGMVTPVGTEPRFQVGVYLEQFDVVGGPLLRAIHASPDAPLVDISTATGRTLNTPPLFSGLGFLDASPMQGVAIGRSPSVRLGVAPARSTVAAATFVVNTAVVERAFAVIAGALTPAPGEQSLRMFVVETATNPWQITTMLPAP